MSLVRLARVLALFTVAVIAASAFAAEGDNVWPPMIRDLRAAPAELPQDPRSQTEGGVAAKDCKGCDAEQTEAQIQMRDLRSVTSATAEYASASPFILDLQKRIATGSCKDTKLACSTDRRGLIQIPVQGRGNIGPCGSHHYTPDPPPGVDAYVEPVAGCAFVAVLQEWKKNYCTERSGCTVEWGDISHKSKPYFNTHNDHTSGDCIDIRPLRTGGFVDGGLNIKSAMYSRSKTKQLVGLLEAMGATTVYFNDTAAGGTYAQGHNNHVHVCFKNSRKATEVCNNLKVDTNICPELQ
jgi:hypothetical protein